MADMYPQVVQQETFKQQVEGFHEELLSWYEYHAHIQSRTKPSYTHYYTQIIELIYSFTIFREQKIANEMLNSIKMQKQADAIKYKDELIDGLNGQIQALQDKISYVFVFSLSLFLSLFNLHVPTHT